MRQIKTLLITTCFLAMSALAQGEVLHDNKYGLYWECNSAEIIKVKKDVEAIIKKNNLSPYVKLEGNDKALHAYIPPEFAVGSTLYIKNNPLYQIKNEQITKRVNNKTIKKSVTSQKEILITLLYPGRTTKLKGEAACQQDSLTKLLQLRQNIVFWGTGLEWGWPDGESAAWNSTYWEKGTPKQQNNNPTMAVTQSFNDLFLSQKNYKIGCYTATKAVFIQAYLDFYNHKKRKGSKETFFQSLLSDDEPFVNIEPKDMWYFEEDYDKNTPSTKGKILKLQQNVDANNFVPGDWVYMRNTDENTNKKIGYEGSNTIYLGGGVFSDYYDDYRGGYPYERKLDEVYQWRNGVFSRSRQQDLIKPLNQNERHQLTQSPQNGGLVETYRVSPLLF